MRYYGTATPFGSTKTVPLSRLYPDYNSFRFKLKTNKPAFINVKEMEDSGNTLGESQQERKCSTSLEAKNAGISRDEGLIWSDDVN